MYLSSERPAFTELLQKYHPDIAKQPDLDQGTVLTDHLNLMAMTATPLS